MSTLLKLGLRGYDVKPRLKSTLSLRKNFGDTIHLCDKN